MRCWIARPPQQIESSLGSVLLKRASRVTSLTSTMNQLWAAGGSVIASLDSGDRVDEIRHGDYVASGLGFRDQWVG